MARRPPNERRYTAFLSYSHKDAAAAGRLHRRLEVYRMPWRLIGLETARGTVPERLWPIFRDREELPAATDLSETVRDALAQSETLIVLCSHHSATSLWVAEEIETFRALHPDRPILAAILDGDPPDCFPAALRAFGSDGRSHEPLATDLRPDRDGPRLGLLKLVAGVTGVGLDALVQRDAQRKIRRVTAVTAGALIALLIMTALALVALQARREADRQRAEAEGLVEFMLTDLRNRLRGVGRIEIMEAVNQRALAYYGGQGNFSRRARLLHAIGDDRMTTGHPDAALSVFREARRATAELLAQAPNDPQRLLDHARSEYWIGRVYEVRHDWPVAQRQYALFAAATERLIRAAPNNPDYMKEAGWSAIDLGNIQLNYTRDYPGAQRSYERAVRWFERAARARPQDENVPRVLANAYGYLADSLYAQQLWHRSLRARREQYRLMETLHRAHPENADLAYRFVLAQRGLAALLARVGERAPARAQLIRAYGTAGDLVRRDPRNADWLLSRAFVGCELYFGEAGLPAGISRANLRDAILSARATLDAQHDPRVADFSRCVAALH